MKAGACISWLCLTSSMQRVQQNSTRIWSIENWRRRTKTTKGGGLTSTVSSSLLSTLDIGEKIIVSLVLLHLYQKAFSSQFSIDVIFSFQCIDWWHSIESDTERPSFFPRLCSFLHTSFLYIIITITIVVVKTTDPPNIISAAIHCRVFPAFTLCRTNWLMHVGYYHFLFRILSSSTKRHRSDKGYYKIAYCYQVVMERTNEPSFSLSTI